MDEPGFIIWTPHEGAIYQAWRSSREKYEKAVERGYLAQEDYRSRSGDFIIYRFAYIAWCPIAEDFDAILKRTRQPEMV